MQWKVEYKIGVATRGFQHNSKNWLLPYPGNVFCDYSFVLGIGWHKYIVEQEQSAIHQCTSDLEMAEAKYSEVSPLSK